MKPRSGDKSFKTWLIRFFYRAISAANALALSTSPVACLVSPFQSSERPGVKIRVLRKSPTCLLPTKFALAGSTPFNASRAMAYNTWSAKS